MLADLDLLDVLDTTRGPFEIWAYQTTELQERTNEGKYHFSTKHEHTAQY